MGLPSNATCGDKLAQLHRNNPVRQSVLAAPSQTVKKDIENNIVRRNYRAFASECATVTHFPSCFTQTLAELYAPDAFFPLTVFSTTTVEEVATLRARYASITPHAA